MRTFSRLKSDRIYPTIKTRKEEQSPVDTSQSQSYFTTGGLQPISSSWRQAPWDSRPAISFQLNTCGYSPYITSSLTKGWVCRLQLLLPLSSAVIPASEPHGIHDHILLPHIRDSPNPEGQVPVLYPPGTGFLFVASCDSQDYSAGIRPRFHTGVLLQISLYAWVCIYHLYGDATSGMTLY
jgi:hypothetical protein